MGASSSRGYSPPLFSSDSPSPYAVGNISYTSSRPYDEGFVDLSTYQTKKSDVATANRTQIKFDDLDRLGSYRQPNTEQKKKSMKKRFLSSFRIKRTLNEESDCADGVPRRKSLKWDSKDAMVSSKDRMERIEQWRQHVQPWNDAEKPAPPIYDHVVDDIEDRLHDFKEQVREQIAIYLQEERGKMCRLLANVNSARYTAQPHMKDLILEQTMQAIQDEICDLDRHVMDSQFRRNF